MGTGCCHMQITSQRMGYFSRATRIGTDHIGNQEHQGPAPEPQGQVE